MSNDTLEHKGLNPKLLSRAHRIMEWSNLMVVASSALGITAWFTAHYLFFYIISSIALVLSLIFLWGPVFIGISAPHQGRIVNGILFMVIGILVTHKFIAGILLGGCFFALFGMLPLAVQLYKERKRLGRADDVKEKVTPVIDSDRDTRINRMSEAFDRLSGIATALGNKADELEENASDVDLLKEYLVSGQWLKDFEADENGEIDQEVNRSVLSEDGLYNLMSDLDDLMHSFERLQDRFAADPELEEKLQDTE